MKFHSIFIFLAILLIDALEETKRLSVDDNKERLKTCGTKDYDENENEVISWGKGGKHGEVESTATLISKHHILTSAILVFKEKGKWFYDDSAEFDGKLCIGDKPVMSPVPEDALKLLSFRWTTKGCHYGSCVISRAFIICDKNSWQFSPTFSLPMVVEIETSVGLVTFCLPTENDDFPQKDIHKHYQYDKESQKVFSSDRNITGGDLNNFIELLNTNPYNDTEDKSGPLIAGNQSSKYYLIGIGAYGGNGKANDTAWFYRAKWFTQGFCDWFGICHGEQKANIPSTPEEPKPEPTTEPPPEPTTGKPTIEEPTTEEPTTEKSEEPTTQEILIKAPEIGEPTTEKPSISVEPEKPTNSPVSMTTSEIHKPPTTKESPSPEPTMEPIPVIDLDQEYKEFKEREAEDDRGDWDEWGNDFYRSADFFESFGKRTELFVGFLMMIMVAWRLVLG